MTSPGAPATARNAVTIPRRGFDGGLNLYRPIAV